MKVLLINGSPHEKGCTYTALSEIASELKECGIDSKIFHVGTAPVRGCMGCGGCAGKGRCIFEDTVNTAIEKASRRMVLSLVPPSIMHPQAALSLPSWIGCSMRGKRIWCINPAPQSPAAAVPAPPPPLIS